MANNNTALGVARGVIEVDFSQLEQAAKRIQELTTMMNGGSGSAAQNAARIASKLSGGGSTGGGGGNNNLNQSAQKIFDASTKFANAVDQFDKAVATFANISQKSQQQSRTPSASGGSPPRFGGAGAGGQSGGMPAGMPTFLQFAVFPFAGLAQSAGASGVANQLYNVGNIIGVVDSVNSLNQTSGELLRRMQSLGGVFNALQGFGSKVATALGASATGATALLASIAPMAIAFVGLSVIMGALQKRTEDAAKAQQEYIDRLKEVAELQLGGGTSSDIQERIDTLLRDINVELAGISGIVDAVNIVNREQSGEAPGTPEWYETFVAAVNSLGELGFSPGAAQARVEEANAAIADNTARIKGWKDALDDSSTAVNDAFAAQNAAREAMDGFAQTTIEAIQKFREMDSDELAASFEDIQQSIADNNSILNSGMAISDEYRQSLIDQNDQLQIQANVIKGLNQPAHQAAIEMKKFAEEMKKLPDLLQELSDSAAEYAEETARIAAERNLSDLRDEQDFYISRSRAKEDFEREQAQSDDDFNRSQLKAREDYDRAQLQQDAENEDRRAELFENYQLESKRAEEDYWRDVEKIQRDGRIDVLEAASRLDARAVFESQRKTREQLRQTKEDYDIEKQRRDEDFERQLEDLEDNNAKQRELRKQDFERQLSERAAEYEIQRKRRQEDFARQLAREDADRALRIAREQQDRAIQDALRQQQFIKEITDLTSHNALLNAITQTGYINALVQANDYAKRLAATFTSSVGSKSPTIGGKSLSIPSPFPTSARGAASVMVQGTQIVLGDVGNRSNAELVSLVNQGVNDAAFDVALRLFSNQGASMLQTRGVGG